MSGFDKRLADAADRFISEGSGENETVVSPELDERAKRLLDTAPLAPISGRKENRTMKKSRIVVIAAAVVAALTLAAVAAPMIKGYLNSNKLTETTAQKTEVPEGWIGVYDAEGLDNVRNDLEANYILMADIDLSAYESWMPIGNINNQFMGIFDGNGHVIRNMTIDFSGEEHRLKNYKYYLGLFGYVMSMPMPEMESIVYGEDGQPVLESVRWYLEGYIKNLGIEDSKIIGIYDHDCVGDRLFAGGIAGFGDYILGCYVKNTTVDITVTEQMKPDYEGSNLNIGGIAGEAYLVDSCWTDADITVKAEADISETYISGLAGVASACVTSYFNGTIDCGELFDNRAVAFRENFPPKIITQEVMQELIDRLNVDGSEPYKSDGEFYYSEYLDRTTVSKNARKLYAFYTNKNLAVNDAFELVTTEPSGDYIWVFDPYCSPREYEMMTNIIAGVFTVNQETGERESFIDYCREHGLKYGVYYTYDLRFDPETDFEGFDFEHIWKMNGDGLPVQRIFG